MATFLKATAGALVCLILYMILSKRDKDLALLLSLAACCFLAGTVLSFLEPVMQFISKLQVLGQLDGHLIQVLTKSLGVGLLAEIAGLACADAGNASLGKLIQLLAVVVILWMALPLLTQLLELVEEILVNL